MSPLTTMRGASRRPQAAGIATADLRKADWSKFAALVLAPGVPLTHPAPHWTVQLAQQAGVEVIGDIELFCRERRRVAPDAPLVAITGTNGNRRRRRWLHISRHRRAWTRSSAAISAPRSCRSLRRKPAGSTSSNVRRTRSILRLRSIRRSASSLISARITSIVTARWNITRQSRNVSSPAFRREGPPSSASMTNGAAQSPIVWSNPASPWCEFQCGTNWPTGFTSSSNASSAPAEGKASSIAEIAGIGSLRGQHNAQNAACATAAALALGLSPAAIQLGLRSFPGLAHRMEEVGRRGAVLFVNDSKATNADSTAQALACFSDIFWIAGGKPKTGGIEISALVFSADPQGVSDWRGGAGVCCHPGCRGTARDYGNARQGAGGGGARCGEIGCRRARRAAVARLRVVRPVPQLRDSRRCVPGAGTGAARGQMTGVLNPL